MTAVQLPTKARGTVAKSAPNLAFVRTELDPVDEVRNRIKINKSNDDKKKNNNTSSWSETSNRSNK